MQLSGLLGSQSAGVTPSTRTFRPASSLQGTMRGLNQTARTTAIGPPKKRRQVTATAPNLSTNPYSKLTTLLGNAVQGRGY